MSVAVGFFARRLLSQASTLAKARPGGRWPEQALMLSCTSLVYGFVQKLPSQAICIHNLIGTCRIASVDMPQMSHAYVLGVMNIDRCLRLYRLRLI